MVSRLKSLELQGYKTFAGRTAFEFPAEITAIVGPNGAGKSNVADSLRWVLGEQSYSLLRGRKTEDMIFAGSEQRPRASMAAATISFNNEDGWLPIDYAEVSITRRAYRDGQNEYLLNGQRVRLKEIAELLSKSGLAERTYTIIGQGLVDSALSLKPEERRRFFEEAAGIGLFRSRREEAINRLETTRRNLERVQDIVLELQPRLETLEKQVRRAMEYERLRVDLRMLLREWYGFHWHQIKKDLAHAREISQTQDDRVQKTRQVQEEVQNKVDNHRTRLQSTRTELNQLHTESANIHREWEIISRQLAVMDERQRSYLDQKEQLQHDLTRLEETTEASNGRLVSFLDEHKHLQDEFVETQAELEQARKMLNTRQLEREQAELLITNTRKKLVALETKQVQVRAHQNELNGRIDSLSISALNFSSSVENGYQKLQKCQSDLSKIAEECKKSENERQQAESRHVRLKKQSLELEENIKAAQFEKTNLEALENRFSSQIDILKHAEDSLNGFNLGARSIFQAVKNGMLEGEYVSLGSILEVPQEYEIAIAAALGDYLEGILLGQETNQEQALLLLENGDNGRAVLFPMSLNRKNARLHVIHDSGVIGIAADFVKAPEVFQPLVEGLLGRTILVQNRKKARQLATELPDDACIVTLHGESFRGNGVVIAGKDSRASVIIRPRQIREIQSELDKLSKQRVKLMVHLSELQRKHETLIKNGIIAQENLNQAEQAFAQEKQALQEAQLNLNRAQQEYEWQKQKLSDIQEQITSSNEENLTLESELDGIRCEIVVANEKLQEYSRILNALPLDDLQTQVVHWETSLAVTSRAIQDAEKRRLQYEQSAENDRRQQAISQQRLNTVEKDEQALEEERLGLHTKETELNQTLQVLQQKIMPGEDLLKNLEEQYADLQKLAISSQQSLTTAERLSSQAHLDYTRQKEKLDALRKRVEDDFGLVAFEFGSDVQGQTPLPLEIVEQLPVVKELPKDFEENINRQRAQIRRIGAINLEAQSEYTAVRERYDFLNNQMDDLKKADVDLRKVISQLDELMKKEFRETFDAVAAEFQHMFTRLFGGGSASLLMTDEENPTETGIDIVARLPGRREQGLSLLSGGERSLTAVALIFALLKVAPTPFCVLDEVDAMLDEANVGRFCDLLNSLSQRTQFVVITHNRNTVQIAGVIYGVTMARDSTSQIISLKLDEISEEMVR